MAIHIIGAEKLAIALIQILGFTLAETEPTTDATFDPYSVGCCEDRYCQQEGILGRDSYCGYFRRSNTTSCADDSFMEPRRKRAIEGNMGTTIGQIQGGICECVSGYEIREAKCQLKPVECCEDDDCTRSFGLSSFCGSRNFSDTKTCPDIVDIRFRKKRDSEPLPGFCECFDGYFYFYSICRSLIELKGCCFDSECHYIFGNNSRCTNLEDKDTCFGGERRKREAGFINPTGDPFIGECTCLPGFILDGHTCVSESQFKQCCSDEDCLDSLGLHSVCGEPSNGENQEECFTGSRSFVGECTCDLSFVLVNQSCVPQQLICCSDDDCISNSTCVFGIGIMLDVCQDVYNPFTIDPRKRREIGENMTPDPTPQNDVGLCTCNIGFTRVDLTCIPFTESRATTTTITTSQRYISSGSVNTTVETQTRGSPDASTGYRCYNFTCTGQDCEEPFLVETNYCLNFEINCYVAKTCTTGDITYSFGCEDPCGSSTVSEVCYSVPCTSGTIFCNNDTAVLDEYRCETSDAGMLFINIVLFLSVNLLYLI